MKKSTTKDIPQTEIEKAYKIDIKTLYETQPHARYAHLQPAQIKYYLINQIMNLKIDSTYADHIFVFDDKNITIGRQCDASLIPQPNFFHAKGIRYLPHFIEEEDEEAEQPQNTTSDLEDMIDYQDTESDDEE